MMIGTVHQEQYVVLVLECVSGEMLQQHVQATIAKAPRRLELRQLQPILLELQRLQQMPGQMLQESRKCV
jgi:hypothetical protein